MILSNIASILFYFFIFFSVILFSYLYKRTKKTIFAAISVILPALFVALRFRVGTDTEGYIQMFNEVSSMDISQILYKVMSFGIEPFAIFVIKFSKLLGLDCFFFFFVFSILTFSAFFFGIKNISKEHAWLLFPACIILALPFSINIMRQGAAIAVVFLAFTSTLNKDYKKFALPLFILAFTIHFSSILLFPIFILKPFLKKYGLRRLMTAILVVLVFLLFALPKALPIIINNGLLPQKYLDTFGSFSSNLMNFDFLIFSILAFILLLTKNRTNSFPKELNQLFALLVLAGVCYSGAGFSSAYLGRFADFFWPFIIVAIWLFIDRLEDGRCFKQVLFLSAMLIYFTATTILMGNSELIPYGLSI